MFIIGAVTLGLCDPLPRMNCSSQQELQTSRVKWEEWFWMGGTKVHGKTMNEAAILCYSRTWQTTMHLTGTWSITAISCHPLARKGTETRLLGNGFRKSKLWQSSWQNKGLCQKKKDCFRSVMWGGAYWTLEVFALPTPVCVSDVRIIPAER